MYLGRIGRGRGPGTRHRAVRVPEQVPGKARATAVAHGGGRGLRGRRPGRRGGAARARLGRVGRARGRRGGGRRAGAAPRGRGPRRRGALPVPPAVQLGVAAGLGAGAGGGGGLGARPPDDPAGAAGADFQFMRIPLFCVCESFASHKQKV